MGTIYKLLQGQTTWTAAFLPLLLLLFMLPPLGLGQKARGKNSSTTYLMRKVKINEAQHPVHLLWHNLFQIRTICKQNSRGFTNHANSAVDYHVAQRVLYYISPWTMIYAIKFLHSLFAHHLNRLIMVLIHTDIRAFNTQRTRILIPTCKHIGAFRVDCYGAVQPCKRGTTPTYYLYPTRPDSYSASDGPTLFWGSLGTSHCDRLLFLMYNSYP